VLQHILNCDVERESLLKEQHDILAAGDKIDVKEQNVARLSEISERLKAISSDQAESKAIKILTGLGFSQSELTIPSKRFSGGWRMRIAIAKVVFCEPEILLLDEPTNHLDLKALAWLEEYI